MNSGKKEENFYSDQYSNYIGCGFSSLATQKRVYNLGCMDSS
jgi:hypothetical protein